MSNNDVKLGDNFWLFIVVVVGLLRDCGKELGTCRDQAKIMYAWARNAPPTKLPKGARLSPHHFSLLLLFQSSRISLAHITQYKWSRVNGSYLKSNKSSCDLILHSFFSDVGFKVGGDTRINYFVLQIHYGDINNFRGKQQYSRSTAKPEYCEISMF